MKKLIVLLSLIHSCALAQLDLRATLSNTILNVQFGTLSTPGYDYGGAGFGVPTLGLEAEWNLRKRLNPKADTVFNPKAIGSTSLEACLFYSTHNLKVHGYTANNDIMNSSMQVQLMQVPLIFKGNAHLSVLDENLRISFGLGIVTSYVISTKLTEDARAYTRDAKGNAIKDANGNYTWVDYSASGSMGGSDRRIYNSFCLEFSFAFKRLFICERAWFSSQDM